MYRKTFFTIAIIAVFVRFFHFEENLDSPHTWRQADTANYIYDFHKNGIDLLHPSVCWMGGHKTLLLEFPLPEAIVTIGYNIFGESHIVARMFFLLFFIASAFFFYRMVNLFFDKRLTQLATLLYLFTPLSLFYSRAIHIDFFALFLCFGMTYYFIKGYREESRKLLVLATLFAVLAFLLKVPYTIPFILLLLWSITKEKQWGYALKTVYFPIAAVGIFFLWQRWVYTQNDAVPNWDFILGYKKFTDNFYWYFGSLEQRLIWENWSIVFNRIFHEILGWSGSLVLILGIYQSIKTKHFFGLILLLGTMIYLTIFFNLNVVHNYYQIPFIIPLVILAAQGIRFIEDRLKSASFIIVFIPILMYSVESISYSEKNYYIVQENQIEIGEIVKSKTESNELVIINVNNVDPKCPNYLYRARRNGWQLVTYGIDAQMLYKLMGKGASYFVTVRSSPYQGEIANFLAVFDYEIIPMKTQDRNVYIYKLNPEKFNRD